MAQKKIIDLTLRANASDDMNLPVDDSSQTWRVTGAQLKTYLAPFTTLGDWLYGAASGVATRIAGNTTTVPQALVQTGTGSVSAAPVLRDLKAPTRQVFLTGSGTYTTPAGCLYLRVRAVAGGGGGAGSGTVAGTNPGTGGATTFGSSLISCLGGVGGAWGAGSGGAVGGVPTLSAPAIGHAMNGSRAVPGSTSVASAVLPGGSGGVGFFGGGGSSSNNSVFVPTPNSGSGASGAGFSGAGTSGSGGGAGSFIDAVVPGPLSATYAYAVGAGGTAGGAGTGGTAGAAGATGFLEVWEYYW